MLLVHVDFPSHEIPHCLLIVIVYSQAPPSMKSLSQAAWLLTVAFGNLVVVIVAESSLFSNQVCIIKVVRVSYYELCSPL